MLYEIRCSKFKSYGNPRPPIRFHEGLNTVLGGMAADNSVGKSTFMLIIDYVFGGNTYKNSDVIQHIGNHTIEFAFKFDGCLHYYSRNTSSNTVNICSEDYSVRESISEDAFKQQLMDFYHMELPYVTFRDIVSRYLRVFGKDNCSSQTPLHITSKEKSVTAVSALEKLFNEYWKIEKQRTELSNKENIKRTYSAARRLEFLPNATTSLKQYGKNKEEIGELEEKLADLVAQTDREISEEELSRADEISEIKGQITALKRKRSRLKSQLATVNISMSGVFNQTAEDISELADFFPDIDTRKISDIERFHGKMQQILNTELKDEASRLEMLISSFDAEISSLEESQRSLGVPSSLPQTFLDSYAAITHRIDDLEAQNKAYDNNKKFAADVKKAKDDLADEESTVLRNLESQINKEMARLNDVIYNKTRKAPVIGFPSGDKYRFLTPDDTGTGTSFKSLIVFDLSILNLTPLPVLGHDSLLFNDIGYAPLEKIMELYTKSSKQIFIAFDRQEAPTQKIQKILNQTTVLQLSAGGNELFGYSWGTVNQPESL